MIGAGGQRDAEVQRNRELVANGPALAAFLAAGIGAFAMGFFASANEAGIFAAPALYPPAGGVSGRTTFAAIVWLAAWGLLHSRWKDRQMAPKRMYALTLMLVGAGILGTFPLVWRLF
jgi:hypothetical protein